MSSIRTGAYIDTEDRYEHCEFSRAVPSVIYQSRLNGAAIRVERPDKGGHLTLVWQGRVYQIVHPPHGVVGILGWSGQSDAYAVSTLGALDFLAEGNRRPGRTIAEAATLGDIIGEAALYWLC